VLTSSCKSAGLGQKSGAEDSPKSSRKASGSFAVSCRRPPPSATRCDRARLTLKDNRLRKYDGDATGGTSNGLIARSTKSGEACPPRLMWFDLVCLIFLRVEIRHLRGTRERCGVKRASPCGCSAGKRAVLLRSELVHVFFHSLPYASFRRSFVAQVSTYCHSSVSAELIKQDLRSLSQKKDG
jgi:hypothetical protein